MYGLSNSCRGTNRISLKFSEMYMYSYIEFLLNFCLHVINNCDGAKCFDFDKRPWLLVSLSFTWRMADFIMHMHGLYSYMIQLDGMLLHCPCPSTDCISYYKLNTSAVFWPVVSIRSNSSKLVKPSRYNVRVVCHWINSVSPHLHNIESKAGLLE